MTLTTLQRSPSGMYFGAYSQAGGGTAFGYPMIDITVVDASTFVSGLATLRTKNARGIINVMGGVKFYRTSRASTGADSYSWAGNRDCFDFVKWKTAFTAAAALTTPSAIASYVADGTLLAVLMADDVEDKGAVYPGVGPTFTEFEAMAAWIKATWPTVYTCVRSRATWMKQIAGASTYANVDFCWQQWRSTRGTPTAWFTTGINDAKSVNLGVIVGFNYLAGGVGTAPWNAHLINASTFGMSPDEIRTVADAYAAMPALIGMMGWAHPNNYSAHVTQYNDPQIQSALEYLAGKSVGRPIGVINYHGAIPDPDPDPVSDEWSFVGRGTRVVGASASSIVAAAVTGTLAAGDLLVVVSYSQSATAYTASTPSGFTLAKRMTTNGDLAVFFKKAVGNETTTTVSYTGAGGTTIPQVVQQFAFRGNTQTAAEILSTLGASSSWAASINMGPVTGLTSAADGALVIVVAAKQNDFNNGSPPPDNSMSATVNGDETWNRAAISEAPAGTDCGFFLDYAFTTGTPTIGTKSWTAIANGVGDASRSGAGQGFMVSFKPSVTTPTGTVPSITDLTDAVVAAGDAFTITGTATGSTPLTWTLVAGAPTGVAIGSSTGVLTWTPTTGQAGLNQIGVTCTNAYGVDTEGFQVTVTVPVGGTNAAPVITNPGDMTVRTGTLLSFIISATDEDNDPLIYSLPANAPAGTFIDGTTGQFVWVPTTVGDFPIVALVSDGLLESRSTFTITVHGDVSDGGGGDWTRIPAATNRFRRL